MPQLDFIIFFPQVFWLIILFLFLYVIVIHFFLPFFIKILKSRKYILKKNTELLLKNQLEFKVKQSKMNILLNKNFKKTKKIFEHQIFILFFLNSKFDWNLVDRKVVKVLYYNILYYDINVLKSIPLKLKFLNIKIF